MKPLILLHGALGTASDFEQLVPYLSSRYEIYTLDLPGHGKNQPVPEEFSIQFFAEELNNFLNEHKLHQASIFGYSMGGYVACYLESMQSTFDKIYTLGTKFLWTSEDVAKEAAGLVPDKLANKYPAYTDSLSKRHGESHWQKNMFLTAQMIKSLGSKAALPTNHFDKITCKVTVALGDKDKMVSLEDGIKVFRNLPNAYFDVLPGTQHPIDRVNPALLASRLEYFFNL